MENVTEVFYIEFYPRDLNLDSSDKNFKKAAYAKFSQNIERHNWWQVEQLSNSAELWYLKCCQITQNSFR